MSRTVGTLARLPRPVVALVGIAVAVVGAVITFRPVTSLTALIVVIAIAMIATGIGSYTADERPIGKVGALGWIAAGIAVLAWPDLSARGLAVFVGVALIVGGGLDASAGVRGTRDERFAAIVGGLASIVFGVLALAWPDVTLLVVAVVFGARTVLFGVRLAWSAMRNQTADPNGAPEPRGRARRFTHAAVTVVALLVASGLAMVSAKLNEGEPTVSAFYDTPTSVPEAPGSLIRSEPFTNGVPDNATGWRILYTTTRADGTAAVASGLVIVPNATDGPLPVIAWAHGTTGIERKCAPSIVSTGLEAGAFFALPNVIDNGWALVATDYIGLGTEGPHPYLVGEPEGRSVLDAVRAARRLKQTELANETVVWGHSQGGGAALWTGQIAPDYAPDAHVLGVAALAPASNIPGFITNLGEVPGGSIFAAYVLIGYSDVYPDVRFDDYVKATAETTVRELGERCLGEPAALISVLNSIATSMSVFKQSFNEGPMGQRLEENVPSGPFRIPLLVAQGEADSLVVPQVQADYVAGLCNAGNEVDYETYPGLNHVPLVEVDSPLINDLVTWTRQRLAGDAFSGNCS